MPIAITRDVSASLADCQLSFVDRNPIDIAKARAQRRLVSSSVTECNGRRIETRHRRSRVALAEVTQVRQRRRREPTNDRRRLRSSPGQARIFGEREHAGAR